MKKYKFTKSLMDILNPMVVEGSEILDGSEVTIIKRDIDPAHKFVYIKDEKGNVQSVNVGTLSLTKIIPDGKATSTYYKAWKRRHSWMEHPVSSNEVQCIEYNKTYIYDDGSAVIGKQLLRIDLMTDIVTAGQFITESGDKAFDPGDLFDVKNISWADVIIMA